MEAWCRIQFADRYAQPLSSRAKLYLNGELVTDPVIPDGVTSIGSYAFCGSDSLRSVTIPSSVTSIGREAFFDCSALTNIALPDSVESIGVSAFSGCVGLTGMTLPDSVTNIGSEAFYNCSALKSVTIPKSVTGIGERAFGWLLRKEEYYVGPGPLVGFTVYGITTPPRRAMRASPS